MLYFQLKQHAYHGQSHPTARGKDNLGWTRRVIPLWSQAWFSRGWVCVLSDLTGVMALMPQTGRSVIEHFWLAVNLHCTSSHASVSPLTFHRKWRRKSRSRWQHTPGGQPLTGPAAAVRPLSSDCGEVLSPRRTRCRSKSSCKWAPTWHLLSSEQ